MKRSKSFPQQRLLSGENVYGTALYAGDTISGKGELFGENCESDLHKLHSIREKNKPAPLVIPYFGAFMAVLTELSLAAQPRENYAAVSFVFTAVKPKKCPEIRTEQYCTVNYECSLWDIAYENGADINKLVELNTHIRNIMELNVGERVRLY
ncbi:MAG: LysM peptidoglycan-binding domain-containing protein [Clostridia bacterium]|nr:LysM peptidoglycan-binding domain-containing protein [Clostridia bacterium]